MSGSITGIQIFPSDNIWNTRIDTMPVHAQSNTFITRLGANNWMGIPQLCGGSPYPYEGIPYIVVDSAQPDVTVTVSGPGSIPSMSDFGSAPIPANAPIEQYFGDFHVIVIHSARKLLYEMWNASYSGGVWNCGVSATWDLTSNALRTNGHTSADAAGLPIFPGLVRYDEAVIEGRITHALRMVCENTQPSYVWPARHWANNGNTDFTLPPMGQRFRLKASKDISGFSPLTQVVLQACKTYGIIVADNTGVSGSFGVSGCPDTRWDISQFDTLNNQLFNSVTLSDFEAIDESSLQVSADSGAQTGINYRYVGGFAL